MLKLELIRGAENANGVRPEARVHSRQARFVIGRDPKCDWPIPDRALALSARHCEIVLVDGRQVLKDLSTNGTFVNGARKRLSADHVLADGDRIAMGHYLIAVELAPDAGPPAPANAKTVARLARRGGDPAAMVSDWQRADVSAPVPSLDMNSGFTRISKPWLDTSADSSLYSAMDSLLDTSPVTATVPNPGVPSFDETAPPAPLGASAPSEVDDVLHGLAAGLGVTVEELGVANPVVAAQRVARLLRVAVLALHHQLLIQARQLQAMGSDSTRALQASQSARLRMAAGPHEVVKALLGAGIDSDAMLVRAHIELGQHAQRMLAAFGAASERLADQLDPATFERAARGPQDTYGADDARDSQDSMLDAEHPARLWQNYATLWAAPGDGDRKSWPDGFVEAAWALLAATYDDPHLLDKPAG